MPTKSELEQKIADMEQELEAERERVSELEAERDAVSEGGGESGWLITTPNPLYDGTTAGVEFRHGKAFIPGPPAEPKKIEEKKKVVRVGEPPEIIESEHVDELYGAPDIIRELKQNFGYEARYLTSSEIKELRSQDEDVEQASRAANAALVSPAYAQAE